MASKIEQAKMYLDELHKKIVDLNIEVVGWTFDSHGTELARFASGFLAT